MTRRALLVLFGLLAVGCSTVEPAVDASVTEVRVVEGKKFNVPRGVTTLPHIATRKEIEFYKKSGVSDCKTGDVLWEEKSVSGEIAEAIKNGDATIHPKLAKEGKIGCASPVQ